MAQDLVPNGSFEEYTSCPGSFSEQVIEFQVPGWSPGTLAPPDHFHSCSKGAANVPHNWAGVSNAVQGDGFAGIYVWMDSDFEYREYLKSQLIEPLLRDTTYIVEFYFKLSSFSAYAVDRIGLLLTASEIDGYHDKVIQATPTLSVVNDSAFTSETGLWELAQMEYKAKGGEQFILIGNFFSNADTKFYRIQFSPIQQEMLGNSAYYYVDAVKVIPKYRIEKDLVPAFALDVVDIDTPYILKNIMFAFDSYKLHPASFEELDKVIGWLDKHPELRVTLSGHTDDRGGERYNNTLSLNRANTVKAYLVLRGIDASRVTTLGYGKSTPLYQGTSEGAREKNRRVEICFDY
jgi:outer membrane protein OmpA-like peptidoglycan-associated protein